MQNARVWQQVLGLEHTVVESVDFDDTVAWLATQCSKTAVTKADAHRVAHGRGDPGPGVSRHRRPGVQIPKLLELPPRPCSNTR